MNRQSGGDVPADTADLRQAYAKEIHRYSWDFYSTITFRLIHRDPIFAALRIGRALDKLDCSRAFIAIEPHRLDGVHAHLLSRHTYRPEIKASTLWKYFFKAYGRSRVEPIKSASIVSWYCSKYVVKGDFDYSFYGDKQAWLLDP